MKVCFIYESWDNEKTLNVYRKMTPKCNGKWKDMEAVTDEKEADWFVVIDDTRKNLPDDRTLYISAHPQMNGYIGYVDQDKRTHKLDAKDTFGFGEWWLNYDYDYLSAMRFPRKTKTACCIMSNAQGEYGRTRRKEFAKLIQDRVNVYGRIQGVGHGELGANTKDTYWFGKEDVLRDHRYSVEIDVGLTKNYFSERVFDSLLMWCMPLYWGGTNVQDYLPTRSFRYIDIYSSGEDIDKFLEEDPWFSCLPEIEEARQLLLNKYQVWPRVYEYISNHPLH